ncbi:unnamed protein product [Heterobilharzia americana]|nr:unnamed protein product [Heterobilharzia americana]
MYILLNSEKQLHEARDTIRQLNEKTEHLETLLLENKRLFEVNLQAIHITYVNIIENIFEKLQELIFNDLNLLEQNNNDIHTEFKDALKSLGLQCTFHDI